MHPQDPTSGPRRRRARYPGTHPRRFDQRYKELAPERYPGIVEHVRAQGGTPAGSHVPILVDAVLAALDPRPGQVVCDGTLGAGGHAQAILPRLLPGGRLVGIDRDSKELERTRARLAAFGDAVSLHHGSFAWMASVAAAEGGTFDGILLDLGLSSMQIDDPGRGFSFKADGPLDMRMDPGGGRTAAQLIQTIAPQRLAEALRELSDEPDAERIADAIVQARNRTPILTTQDLVRVVLAAQGTTPAAWRARARAGDSGLHPAARTFQAIRILVNGEMDALDRMLADLPDCLRPGGRVVILSFHSGEDRRVKHAFRDGLRGGLYDAVSDEPTRPSPDELRANPRSAPARLRWARRSTSELPSPGDTASPDRRRR